MNTKEQILQMVKDGTLSVEEGIKLLEAMENLPSVIESNDVSVVKKVGKFLRVVVDSAEGDHVRVNIPVSLVKAGLNISQQLQMNGVDLGAHGIDVDMIMKLVEEGELGEFINVDSADGDIVRVFID